jgi:hypothetical protein
MLPKTLGRFVMFCPPIRILTTKKRCGHIAHSAFAAYGVIIKVQKRFVNTVLKIFFTFFFSAPFSWGCIAV